MMVRARNEGAKLARGDYVLFVDDDNIVDASMMSVLVDAADRYASHGILGPTMYYAGSREKYMDYQLLSMWTGRTHGIVDSSESALCESDGIPNVFLVKQSVFRGCGYFDEAMIQTFTEPDFALAARKRGFRCGIVKRAKTFHDVSMADSLTPRALGGQFSQKAYCLMRNRSVLVARYGVWYQKTVYVVCFSWLWPLIYSILVAKERRWDLVRMYGYGFRDGLIYLFTGRLVNSLPLLMRAEKGKGGHPSDTSSVDAVAT